MCNIQKLMSLFIFITINLYYTIKGRIYWFIFVDMCVLQIFRLKILKEKSNTLYSIGICFTIFKFSIGINDGYLYDFMCGYSLNGSFFNDLLSIPEISNT